MNQERILKQIPKQRRSVENYQQPFPAPEVPVDEIIALADLALKDIDEALGDDTASL